jgi:O-antigen/teichoic acid export membrane protein
MTRKGLLAALAGSVGARLAGAALGLLTQILIARSFSQAEVGTIFLTMSMAAIMSLIVTAGYPGLALTELPRYWHFKQTKAPRMLFAVGLRDWAFLTVLIIVGALFSIYVLGASQALTLALIFGLLSSPVSAAIRHQSSIANAAKRFAVTFVPDITLRPALFMLVLVTAYLFNWKLSLVAVLTAFVVANAIAAIAQFPFMKDLVPPLLSLPKPGKRFATVIRRRSYAIAVVTAVATMFADIVTLLGGLILPPEDVGVLGVTIRLAAIAGFFIQSAQQLVTPDLSVALASNDDAKTNALLLRFNVLTMSVIVAAFLGALFLGRFALGIFGSAYASGYGLLLLFMVGQAIRAFSGMNQAILSISGFQVRTVTACLLALVFLVLFWVLFVRGFGLIGVGYAVIGAELVWSILLASLAQRLTGRRGDFLWVLTKRNRGGGLSA